ncbi:MAG: triphosphoribosyl-dephospho-CoA synthase [Gemmatimonadota bacterium]|nr:triphosphoribosyl-dephospho-CoA synthase [Gemmatimonadota bacterium]MDH4347279.1 triphosphoribosyl-dephospho-CoA synthase [Gemmatimonadota bacterium]MDH5283450.1 triphosphoribosyl-dephospho-CoA synthase [Gemmatimonadota bacterium]
MTFTAEILGALATQACLLEAGAPKPGNVSPGRPFRDMRYEDFVASAVAAGPELGRAGERQLGETILAAVRATRQRTSANTNLGIILLLAPLARAAAGPGEPLSAAIEAVLERTTVADAVAAYEAIRLSRPGGLGAVPEADVRGTPTLTLRAAMALAADRDAVAREYASGYATTFGIGAPALRRALSAGLSWEDAMLETYLTLLAHQPDTLIGRKLGLEASRAVSTRAAEVLVAGGVRTAEGRKAIAAFDADLRDPQNTRNPGTTADLTAAAIFVTLIEDARAADRSRISRAQ